jgi:cob(I)alamin adenosyltransferase
MRFQLSKIITRTGDKGQTRLGDGSTVSKSDPRIMAIGAIDELNTSIGVLRAYVDDLTVMENLITIQHQLLVAGSQMANSQRSALKAEHLAFLESWADTLMQALSPMQDFVLPGGSKAAAHCHTARVTCRRTERQIVAAGLAEDYIPLIIQYVNRLSDVLFILARVLNQMQNVDEIVLNRQI